MTGDDENSKWLMERCNFFPAPELRITGRMKAPGESTEDELAALMTPEVIEALYEALTAEPVEGEGDPSSGEGQGPETVTESQDDS